MTTVAVTGSGKPAPQRPVLPVDGRRPRRASSTRSGSTTATRPTTSASRRSRAIRGIGGANWANTRHQHEAVEPEPELLRLGCLHRRLQRVRGRRRRHVPAVDRWPRHARARHMGQTDIWTNVELEKLPLDPLRADSRRSPALRAEAGTDSVAIQGGAGENRFAADGSAAWGRAVVRAGRCRPDGGRRQLLRRRSGYRGSGRAQGCGPSAAGPDLERLGGAVRGQRADPCGLARESAG